MLRRSYKKVPLSFTTKSCVVYKQQVQGLQAFAFSIVTINNKHAKPRSKESVGVKFKEGICAELCLKF